MNLEPMPSEGKAATQSVTVWGAAIALVSALLPTVLAHLHVTPTDAQSAAQDVGNIIAAVSSLVAIYGRTKGSAPLPPITSVTPKG